MTSINVNTNIDQAFIDSNTGPYVVDTNVEVTIIEDLTLDLSQSKYFSLRGIPCKFNGKGNKVTLVNTTSDLGSFALCSTGNRIIEIRNLGIISGSGHSLLQNNGGLLTCNFDGVSVTIENCYYFGNVNALNSGGIYGSNRNADDFAITTSIKNCYVIGDVTGTNAGGIVGSGFGNSSKSMITNCYVIGNVSGTNAGAIAGAEPGYNNGQVYIYNTYNSSGNIFGSEASDDAFVATKRVYSYNNSWSDSNATSAGLSTSSLSTTDMTSSSGWTQYGTGSGSFNLTSTDLNVFKVSNGESTQFSFTGNTPYGITSYTVSPYLPGSYTSATSRAANCFCVGTKITLKNGKKVNIEDIIPGDEVMTPYGVTKKVLKVGRMWYNNQSRKHDPCMIPKDFFNEGLPSEDTYVSGEHCLLFSNAEADLLGLKLGKNTEKGKGLLLYLSRSFAEKQEFQKVCILKGESKLHYGFYYYHLVIEDDLGFMANNLPSESITLNEFKKNFEEINKNINEEVN